MAKTKIKGQPTKTADETSLLKVSMLSALVIGLGFSSLYLYREKTKIEEKLKSPVEKPTILLRYEKFRRYYPRFSYENMTLDEESRRHLLFNADMHIVARHNIAYIGGKTDTKTEQSPFIADRTESERDDVFANIEDFNIDKFPENPESQDAIVKGPGAQVESGNVVDRFFTRAFKGSSYFDIPSYPLDKQPDPNKITHIDTDLRDCAGSLKDQKDCGACYAFSWTSFVAWHRCKQTGKQVDLSAQHLIDCGHKANMRGCFGGRLKQAVIFSQLYGLHTADSYPYKAKENRCDRLQGDINIKLNDWTRVKVDRNEWEKILFEQPILVHVNLPSDILKYKRGVHPGNNCNSEQKHGMLLVGHGRQEGVPYWLLRNSMGKNWGENGYLRLSRDAPMTECFATGFVGKIKFKDIDEDNYNEFYDQVQFKPSLQPEIIVTEKVKNFINSK